MGNRRKKGEGKCTKRAKPERKGQNKTLAEKPTPTPTRKAATRTITGNTHPHTPLREGEAEKFPSVPGWA